MSTLSSEEYLQLSNELEQHHAVFYKLWALGKPNFVNDTNTAYVQFDTLGEVIQFGINENYWKTLTLKQKCFIICHECLHVILNHGSRHVGKNYTANANIAADVVINHLLVRSYNFIQEEVDPKKEYCWVDTVPGLKDLPTDECTEFYYNRISKTEDNKIPNLVDDHNQYGGVDCSSEPIIEKLDDELTPEEKATLQKDIEQHGQQAGKGTGGWTFINVGPVKKKRKWESVIKKWMTRYIRDEQKEQEQWVRINRRFVNISSGLMIPTEMEIDEREEDQKKIKVFFFLDTSGSCWNLKDRFFKAARSLPDDRFEVRGFCFDTTVHEVDIYKNKVYGGGGTSFRIIENKIQSICQKEKCDYPAAVWIITDGWGDYVHPAQPKKWYWFLSEDCTSYIPKECHTYKLKDYE